MDAWPYFLRQVAPRSPAHRQLGDDSEHFQLDRRDGVDRPLLGQSFSVAAALAGAGRVVVISFRNIGWAGDGCMLATGSGARTLRCRARRRPWPFRRGRGGGSDFGPVCKQRPGDFACQLVARADQAPASLPDSRQAQDRRIKAAVVVAPALGFTLAPSGLKDVKVPIQLWHAEDDTLLPHPRYAEAVRKALPDMPDTPDTPDYRVMPHAGHFDFMPPCSKSLAELAPAICTSAPGFDRAAFQQTFNTAVIAFFGKALKPGQPG